MELTLLREHPYATGAAVIIGGLAVFYLVSSNQSGAGSSTSATGGNDLAAYGQMQQTQLAAAIQSNAQNAALQQSQLQAQVANNQIAASVDQNQLDTLASLIANLNGTAASVQQNSDTLTAQTTEQANQLVYAQNIQSLQDSVLMDQIDQQTIQLANSNSTTLDAFKSQLAAATGLAYQQQNNWQTNVAAMLPLAGQQKNSALDANNQTSLFQTILSGGNPNVAASGNYVSYGTAASGDAASASKIASISSAVSKIGTAIAGGVFGG